MMQKNRHLGTIPQFLSGYIFATKACIDNWKKLVKQQYLPHMPLQYGQWLRFKFGSPGTLKNLGPYCKLKGPLSTCLYH